MNNIIGYDKCQCGAITLYFADGTINSIKQKNLKKFGIDLRKIKRINKQEMYACDHCINHYGLDICSCGSGKEVGKCKCGSTEPFQTFGKSCYDVGGWFDGLGN